MGPNFGIANQSCVASGGYIACVGGVTSSGVTSAVYYGPLASSGGVTSWTKSQNSYPTPIADQSCVASGGDIYCVGGSTGNGYLPTSATYYATFDSSGVGSWTATTPYGSSPTPIANESCVVLISSIFCVGGNTGTGPTSAVYYAALTSGGIGSWTATTPYGSSATPIEAQSCVAGLGGNAIVCVGGNNGTRVTNAVNYATFSGLGIGSWAGSALYPTLIEEQSCFANAIGGTVYCVGGFTGSGSPTNPVYYGPLSSGGVTSWTIGASSYPTTGSGIEGQSCVVSGGYGYCVAGYTGSGFTSAVNFQPAP